MANEQQNNTPQVTNPFGAPAQERGAGAMVQADRAQQEIQAAMTVAAAKPRDAMRAMDRILQDCSRPTVAEIGLYAYPKGGETVSGPSIRLAELIAQRWGNLWCGVTELQQDHDKTVAMAWAWDLETNARDERTFTVPHWRHTRRGGYRIEDPREIYELVANYGARRKRAAIQTVVPREVFDAASEQVERTLAENVSVDADAISKTVQAFAEYGVSQDQLVRYIGHRLDTMITAEMVRLRKVYASIRDGFAAPGDFFPEPEPPSGGSDNGQKPQSGADRFRQAAQAARGGEPRGQAQPDPGRNEQPAGSEQPEQPEQTAEPAPANQAVKRDHFGERYDSRIHSESATWTKEGRWRRKRGVSDDEYERIRAENIETDRGGAAQTESPQEPTGAAESDEGEGPGEGPGDEDPAQPGQAQGDVTTGTPDFDPETGETAAPDSGPTDGEIMQRIQNYLPNARENQDLELLGDLEDEAREIRNEEWRGKIQTRLQSAREEIEGSPF